MTQNIYSQLHLLRITSQLPPINHFISTASRCTAFGEARMNKQLWNLSVTLFLSQLIHVQLTVQQLALPVLLKQNNAYLLANRLPLDHLVQLVIACAVIAQEQQLIACIALETWPLMWSILKLLVIVLVWMDTILILVLVLAWNAIPIVLSALAQLKLNACNA